MTGERRLMIDGQPVQAEEDFGVVDPASGAEFARCPLAKPDHLELAVSAARRAFPAWSQTPLDERARLCNLLGDALEAQSESLAALLSREQGKPLKSAHGELHGAIVWLRAACELRPQIEVLQDDDVARVEVHRRPLGVVGSITPWNFPLMIAVWHVLPALIAGNTVISKPPGTTPLSTLRMIEIANGILPPGVWNSVTGQGEIGRAMSAHTGIDKIVFTGSTPTGRDIMERGAVNLKRLTLELGGNDAAIVLADADVEKVAPKIFAKAFGNSGQVCAAIKRVYAHEDIHDALASRIAELAREAKVAGAADPTAQFGPVQNRAQFEFICELARDARERGGRFLTGGEPLEGPGYLFPLSVVVDVANGTRIVDEEQFGPILPIIRFTDDDSAIAAANANENGLGGSVWSSDIDKATQLAQRLECGTAWVNDHSTISPNVPFGGAKQSGIGVEFGMHGLAEYLQLQTVRIAKS